MGISKWRRPARLSALGLTICAAVAASPAWAQTFRFTGTRENVNPITPPGGRCVPPFFNTVNIAPGAISSTGTSNISSFTSTQSHCITSLPPTQVREGVFEYRFQAGDTIFGTYDGSVTNSATPGVFNGTENLTITGGTGRFVGATGSLTSSGLLRIAAGPTGVFEGQVNGSINATETTASGNFATALGRPSAATGDFSTAIGAFSFAPGARSTALGSFAEATGAGATSVGNDTFASGLNATAVGQGSTAQGIAATAIGHNSGASALASFAGGVSAQATGVGSTALGRVANASAAGATALGASASATFAGSTAIGTGAATTAANQVSLGGTGSSVRVGDIAASTAAQTGTVGVATVDSAGTLGRNTTILPAITALQTSSGAQAAQITALESARATMEGQVGQLFDLANVNRRDIRRTNEGVAMALSMDSPHLPAGANFGVSGGFGFFGSRVAGTAAFSARIGAMSAFSAGLGVGINSGKVGGKAGFQHAW